VPGGGNGRSLRDTAVDHPSPLETKRRIDLAALGTVIAIGEFVLADKLAVERGPRQRAEGRAVPPGEEAQEKSFHPQNPPSRIVRLVPSACRFVQQAGSSRPRSAQSTGGGAPVFSFTI